MLNQIRDCAPRLYRMAYHAYGQDSLLSVSNDLVASASGVQQGDPAGPAFFCLALKPLTDTLQSELTPCYLDDCTLGGAPADVIADIKKVQDYQRQSGLELNTAKCELFVVAGSDAQRRSAIAGVQQRLPGVTMVTRETLSLLGAPLLAEAMQTSATKKRVKIERLCRRVADMHPQQALYLLRHSLLVPRVIYLLRTAPYMDSPHPLQEFDSLFRSTTEAVLNKSLPASVWAKATLPLDCGGLGIRSPTSIATPCYVSSLHSTTVLTQQLLPPNLHRACDDEATSRRDYFTHENPGADPTTDWASQAALDGIICAQRMREIDAASDSDAERARLQASRHRFARRWLEALPSSMVGTLLDPLHFRVSVSIRLGGTFCEPHPCNAALCQSQVDSTGLHGLVCAQSAGWHPRHDMLNAVIADGFRSARVPNRREPGHLLLADGKRPDGVTLVPYSRGRCVIWDACVRHTLAASYIGRTAKEVGAAASEAERAKLRKYATFANTYTVVPLAFETLGSLGASTNEFLDELASRIRMERGNRRAGEYFLQHLSLSLQRGNALAVLGSMGPLD